MDVMRTETRIIRVRVVRHRTTNLLVAVSDDLRGLIVPGKTDSEIEEKLPGAIREILEAQGHKIVKLTAAHDPDNLPTGFESREIIANAELMAA